MRISLLFCRPTPEVYRQSGYLPPLGLAQVASALERAGHAVQIVDQGFTDLASYRRHLEHFRPRMVGISLDSPSLGNQQPYLHAVRDLLPEATIVAGGPHPTLFGEALLEADPDLDVLVSGEGELTAVELSEAIDGGGDLECIPGLVLRTDGGPLRTEPRPPIQDLTSLPWPAHHLLDLERYLRLPPDLPFPLRTAGVLWSRGCACNCVYCQPIPRTMFGPGIRRREVEDVVDEMAFLADRHRVAAFCWNDAEPFFGARDWQLELAETILSRGLKIRWGGQTRVDAVDRETLTQMQRAGLYTLSFGVEAGSPEMLRRMRKGFTVAQVEEVFQLCRELGIVSAANLMLGTPGETHETLAANVDLIRRIRPDLIRVAITVAVPGTDLYIDLEHTGAIQLTDWREINAKVTNPIRLEHLGVDDIERSIHELVRTYFGQIARSALDPRQLLGSRRHLFVEVARHFLSLLGEPRFLMRELDFYLRYARHRSSQRVGHLTSAG